jgi:autotransporter-associated beta strand protein
MGPGSGFSDGSNWSAGVPTDVAEFSGNVTVSPNVSAPSDGQPASRTDLQLNTLAFDAGAGPYTLTLDGTARRAVSMTLSGAGITNASGSSQKIINTGGSLIFNNQASAGNATLINQTNLIDLTPGRISFAGASTAGQAAILNQNFACTIDMSGLTTSGMTAGSIDGTGTFVLGDKNLTLTASDGPHVVSGLITGTGGSLTLNGNQALTLSGANTFTGPTTINAGSVYLTGVLPGMVTVGPGTQLGGTGTAGAVVNNGVVAPEHLRTLHVASYSGPGTLAIDFENEQHSALDVAGAANVSGGKLLVTSGLPFKQGSYSVVHAGTLSGTFASFSHPDSAFLMFQDRYAPQDVFVDIQETGTTFTSVAQNGNQTSVGTVLDLVQNPTPTSPTSSSPPPLSQDPLNSQDPPALDSPIPTLPPTIAPPLQQALSDISLLSADQARTAFSMLSGDALTYFQNMSLRNASLFDHQMNERAHPTGGVVTAGLKKPIQVAYAGDIRDLIGVKESSPENNVWARGLGFFDHTDADASLGSPEGHATTGGVQAGYDHTLGDHGLMGLSAGYAHTTLRVDDRASSGNADSRQVGLYGSYTPGHWFFNASGGYTLADNAMTRGIDFPGVSTQAESSFKSHTYTGFGEAGYAFMPKDHLSLEPSAAVEYNHIDQDGFTETGAPGFNLTVADQKFDSLVSSLGLRIARLFKADSAHPYILGVRGAWQHEFHDVNNSISARFAETPTANFLVQGTPQKRNAAAVGFDGRLNLTSAFQLFANYAASLSSGKTDHGILGGLSIRW